MGTIEEHTAALDGLPGVDGLPVFWRRGEAPGTPPLYVHGVPTSADDWTPFLERTGGIAVDLPGFGRSGKPGHFPYSITGYERFLEVFLDHLGVERVSLVVHDWGGAALAFAQRRPERIERLVIVNSVPLLPGYRWHRLARGWRTPVLGELLMGITTKASTRFLTRESNVTPGPLPAATVDSIWSHFDQGTQRAILRLYRSAPPETLAAAGSWLGTLDVPALVVWGERDPYIDPSFADAYAAALPQGRVLRVPDAGHWPWLDRPDLIDRIAEFLAG